MDLWQWFQKQQLSWTVLAMIGLFWLAVLFLRRALPDARRNRGRWSSYALGVALLLHLCAGLFVSIGLPAVGATLHACTLALVATATAGVVAMIVFDIVLARTRFAVSDLIRDLTQIAVFALIAAAVLQSTGINPLSIVATSTVFTAVVGLAMQNALANVGAGILFQIDGSIRVGDWIQFGSRYGRVETFFWRATGLRTPTGDLAIVPHTQLLAAEVLNLSRPHRAHRFSTRLTFHRRHAPGDVAALVKAALRDVPGVLSDPAPICAATDFSGDGVVYAAHYWLDDIDRESTVEGDVHQRIWYASWRAGFEGPCPARAKPDDAELDEARGALRTSKLFGALDAARREQIVSRLREMRYAAGECILREGDAGASLFVLSRGEVRVEREGVDEVLTFGPGDVFGEMSLLTGAPRAATCRAAAECACWELDGDAFRALIDADVSLAEAITGLVAVRQAERERARQRASKADHDDVEQAAMLWVRVKEYFRL